MTTDSEQNGESTAFLDIEYALTDVSTSFNVYRKPMNTYQYTPFDSEHARSTLISILHAELVRLPRASSTEASYAQQQVFFKLKLSQRGYPCDQIDAVLRKYPYIIRHKYESPGPKNVRIPVVAFKIPYRHGIDAANLGKILRKHQSHLLDKMLPVVCFTANKNLFRERIIRFR